MKPLIKLKTLQLIHTCYHTNRLTFGGKKKNVNVIGERWEKKEKKINPMHPSMPSLRINSAQPRLTTIFFKVHHRFVLYFCLDPEWLKPTNCTWHLKNLPCFSSFGELYFWKTFLKARNFSVTSPASDSGAS